MTMMPLVNPLRGELLLTVSGRTYLLRPSFNALAQTEAMAGCGLLMLARRFVDGSFGLRDVVAVLLPAVKDGSGEAPADLGDLLLADGLIPAAGVAARLLTAALRGWEGGPGPLSPAG